MAHIEISPKSYHVRIYERKGDHKYLACYQLHIDGDKGQLHSLAGKDFYKNVIDSVGEMFERTGLKEVEARVAPSHASFIESALNGVCRVERLRDSEHMGRTLVLIRLSRPS